MVFLYRKLFQQSVNTLNTQHVNFAKVLEIYDKTLFAVNWHRTVIYHHLGSWPVSIIIIVSKIMDVFSTPDD